MVQGDVHLHQEAFLDTAPGAPSLLNSSGAYCLEQPTWHLPAIYLLHAPHIPNEVIGPSALLIFCVLSRLSAELSK